MLTVPAMESDINTRRFLIETPAKLKVAPALALFLFTIMFLYAFRPMEISDNSLVYIFNVRQGEVFYPPHLLHAAIIGCFYVVLSNIAPCDVVCAGMVHSMIWAGVTIASVYMIARSVLATAGGALLTAAMVLVAHGFWVFATQLEVYVPSVGCVAAAGAVLFTNRNPTLSPARVIAVAVLWALATTYHVANVFLFIPFCAYFIGAQGLRGWRQLAVVSALAGGLVWAAFVTVYLFEQEARSVDGFFTWAFALTDVPMTDWGSLSNWQPVPLLQAGWRQITALTLLPEYLTSDQRPLWIIGAFLVVSALLWNVIQIAYPDRPAGARVYFILLFATNFLFFAWWQPTVHKFFIPSSIPLIMLMAMALHDLYLRARATMARRLIVGSAVAVIAVVFTFNLSSALELRRSLGPDYAEAAVLDRITPENCTIYSVGHHINPLRVYFDRTNYVSIRYFLSAFYSLATGEPRPERIAFEDEECALMPLGFLAKNYYDRYAGTYVGEALWPDYVGFFFNVKPDAAAGVTYNAFELVAEGDGPPHVLVDRQRRVHARSAQELAEVIGAEVDRAMQKFAADWPSATEPYLAYVPRVNVEIDRLRQKIFGYSFGEGGRKVGRPGD
jgi:hypothetical protein